jgi:hypothetical protein
MQDVVTGVKQQAIQQKVLSAMIEHNRSVCCLKSVIYNTAYKYQQMVPNEQLFAEA